MSHRNTFSINGMIQSLFGLSSRQRQSKRKLAESVALSETKNEESNKSIIDDTKKTAKTKDLDEPNTKRKFKVSEVDILEPKSTEQSTEVIDFETKNNSIDDEQVHNLIHSTDEEETTNQSNQEKDQVDSSVTVTDPSNNVLPSTEEDEKHPTQDQATITEANGNLSDQQSSKESNLEMQQKEITEDPENANHSDDGKSISSQTDSLQPKNQNENDAGVSLDNVDNLTHPYIGKYVKILNGAGKGSVEKLVAVHSRGWWTLSQQEGVVHSRRCQLLDEVSIEEMKAFYEKQGKRYRVRDRKRHKSAQRLQKQYTRSASNHEDCLTNDKEKTDEQTSQQEQELLPRSALLMTDLLKNAIQPLDCVYCDHPEKLQYVPIPGVLPPIVRRDSGMLPSGLEHLDSNNDNIVVLDRKRGITFNVPVKTLDLLLREHPEYEPVISSDETPRQARSTSQACISARVLPQPTTVHPNEGLCLQNTQRKLKTALPGGWYELVGDEDSTVILGCKDRKHQIKDDMDNSNHELDNHRMENDMNAMLCSVWNSALLTTVQTKSTACKDRIQTLHNDQLDRESKLTKSVDKAKRELLKQLDYVKSCRKHAEQDFLHESLASEATLDIAERIWNDYMS